MILTCPDCATSYFVDDDRVPPQGRTVKCTSCGNRWRALPDGAPEPEAEPPPPAPILESADPDPEPDPPAPEDDLEFVAAPVTPKRKASEGAKKRPVGLFVGLGVAVLLAGAIGAAVLFRQPVVDRVPAVAPLFKALGLKVDTLGLVIEDVMSKAVLQGGRPALSITGVVRNKNKVSTEAPPIRISLMDQEGVVLAALLAQPLNAKVPPGARRYFAVSFPDPPANAARLETAFDLTARPAPAHAEAPAHGAAAAHPPEAVEAQPLPADSPDALAPHEQH